MIHSIRTSKFSKVIASYLALQLMITTVQPTQLFALSSGPSQPEFNSFTPIGTSDMVNLSTGDFNYNIPIMDVGGYPLNLAYDSGITMDQEASWVGLGWNLNVGQINRQVRGIPDDFKGDEMLYERNLKPNVTVGISAQASPQVFGLETEDYVKPFNGQVGLGIQYNNYNGISFTPSYGLSFSLSDYVTVGMNVQTSATEGATISPSLSARTDKSKEQSVIGSLNAGVSLNSNKGLTSFGLGASLSSTYDNTKKVRGEKKTGKSSSTLGSTSGNISFSNITLTPRKRTAFKDTNTTFSFSGGVDVWGVDAEIEISATASVQQIKEKAKTEKAYGYEHTGQATKNDVLDYNRENDRIISKNLLALPSTNYTYDLYSVNGQGISGMFRPHRSQIGQIYDEFVKDESSSLSLGAEIEGGTGWHVGANFVKAKSESYTGAWQTKAANTFKNENENENNTHNSLDYEPVYFKYVGENKVDDERALYVDQLHGDKAMAVQLGGTGFNRFADKQFRVKGYELNNPSIPKYEPLTFTNAFKRTKRDVRNQSIQKITGKELRDIYSEDYYNEHINAYAEEHHTAEIRMLKPDGATYVFGETAYNIEKQEVTFSTNETGDCATGIVNYASGENTKENTAGIDRFYDKVVTPAYAHTYLLSSVLSSDYEDLTGDGPTDDDLGTYTRFEYEVADEDDPYQWRIPFGSMEASYNEGLRSNKADQKGSYLYGRKEIKYIKKIETKTHVAIFKLSEREDGIGVVDHNGGQGAGRLKKIDQILLYSKPEYQVFASVLEDTDPNNDPDSQELSPIKTAHFEYNYDLCGNLPNNTGDIVNVNGTDINLNKGKLTLNKVYFTYRSSKMGKYTPYTFNYDNDNPDYNLKGFDIWGNYKPNDNGSCDTNNINTTTAEYPFVDQQNKLTQDQYAAAWSISSIGLPSGGSIDLTFESDDYQYVQDKPVLNMFKVAGAGEHPTSDDPVGNQLLYKSGLFSGDAKYLYVELPNESNTLSEAEFENKYLKGIKDKPMYFRFLLNMTKKGAQSVTSSDYDYVTGYFELDSRASTFKHLASGKIYAAIPMATSDMEGGVNGSDQVNPISKAGWYFGRTYLNGIVYGLNQDYRSENVATIAKKLVSSIGAVGEIFTGPNAKLRSNSHLCAQQFIPAKSWIRLSTPSTYKLGGGSRVKQLEMNDHWDGMTLGGTAQSYGQSYNYTLEDQSSSGVATFEPNDSAENPFVEPFYDKGQRLIAPREVSYVEKPFGKAFFPYSNITYSRVTVKNIERADITRHATGKVVSEFYTTKDFPTKVDYTDIESHFESNQNNVLEQLLGGLFGLPVRVKNEFALSQGYVVHTNDMDGKTRSQKVYQEGVANPISTVEYRYSAKQDDQGVLDNVLPVIAKNGDVSDKEIGVDYDVITDFRESYSKLETKGLNTNVAALLFGIFPIIIPTSFPVNTKHENVAHSVITTKTVHTTAILKEKIATDLGSKVSTVNQAWSAETGEIILTKTINEFDDTYYNFNFPTFWAYNGMGQASKNLGIKGVLSHNGEYFTLTDADKYLTLGDEIIGHFGNDDSERLWVVGFNNDNTGVLLMDRSGQVVNKSDLIINEDIAFKIMRSGYRNQQTGNMGAITMMNDPLKNNATSINTATFLQDGSVPIADNLRIINASAVAYDDFWNAQCENGLTSIPYESTTSEQLADLPIENYNFNPYMYNVKGEWRAEKSYAYLTERTDVKEGISSKINTRKEGYFKEYTPFHGLVGQQWEQNPAATNQIISSGPWTFASEVTQYSPYGAELENKDALNRYSSAQYGYNFTLPTAVASNSRYRYMGSDNFEDYNYLNTNEGHFTYKDIVDKNEEGIGISNTHAHTGNTSLLVRGGQAGLPKELIGEIPPDLDTDDDGWNDISDNCPYTSNPNQEDYDNDGIGDICDDNAVPRITDKLETGQIKWWKKQVRFTIQGKPNDVVRGKVIEIKHGRHGWKAFFNGGAEFKTPTEFEIQLDASGRAPVTFEVAVDAPGRRRKRKKHNHTIVEFVLLNKNSNAPLNEAVRLHVVGFKKPKSGGNAPKIFPSQF